MDSEDNWLTVTGRVKHEDEPLEENVKKKFTQLHSEQTIA